MTRCKYCDAPEHPGVNCDRELLKAANTKLREELRLRSAELQATRKLEGPGVVMVSSLISHRSKTPRIDIQFGELHTQMPVDAAVDVARNMLEVCAGSYADGFIFNFLTEKLSQSEGVAAQIIEDFRDYRMALAEKFKKESSESGS